MLSSNWAGGDGFEISVVTGNENVQLAGAAGQAVRAQSLRSRPATTNMHSLKDELAGSGIAVAAGVSGLVEAADLDADWVMAAIVGTAGLAPTLAAAPQGRRRSRSPTRSVWFPPADLFVDAVAQWRRTVDPGRQRAQRDLSVCWKKTSAMPSSAIILTASGGPFRTCDARRDGRV